MVLGGITLAFGCGGNDAPSSAASGSVTSSGSGGSGSSGSGAGGAGGGCNYPPVNNPEGCPPAYSHALSGEPCAIDGLECWYPGVGDSLPDGCNASALLRCTTDFSDAGAEWIAAQ